VFPELISFGPLKIHTYGVMVALGFLAGILVTHRLSVKAGSDPRQMTDLILLMIVCGLVGSRLLYVIINLSDYSRRPLDILKIWEGGLVFSGGLLGAGIALIAYTRTKGISLPGTADILAPGAAIGQAIGRIGCFFAGCCYGLPSDLPWAVTFTHPEALAPLNRPLHPIQLYSALLGAAVFTALILIHRHRTYRGQTAVWFLIMHSTVRLFLERYRGDDRGFVAEGVSATQLIALVVLFLSIGALFYLKKNRSSG
jgi:phosphatidylglycerol:prolipoprotein diacylglycerol transferase